eukprot:gene7275-5119_t
MSFRIQDASPLRNASLITPGTGFRVLATAATLRRHLTDSYWCEFLDNVCEGRLEGVAVRYTGKNVVLVQFRPAYLTASGHRYPVSVSIPSEFLVPAPNGAELSTSFAYRRPLSFADGNSSIGTQPEDDAASAGGPDLPKLCVVCGRFDVPEMLKRRSGWKCRDCKGTPSSERLRHEAARLNNLALS